MGVFNQEIVISAGDEGLSETLEAADDTGALFSQVSVSILDSLGVEAIRKAPFQLADGSLSESDLGEVFLTIGQERTRTICIFGEQDGPVILGAYTLEGLLLAADPVNRRLVPVIAPRLTRFPTSAP